MRLSAPKVGQRPRRFSRRIVLALMALAATLTCAFPLFHFITRRMFFAAINQHDVKTAVQMLKFNHSLVHAEDEWGSTGLDLAIDLNEPALVRELTLGGADVHHEARLTGLPLHHAAFGARVEIMLDLLRAGADPNRQPQRKPSHGYGTALHFAVLSGTVKPVAVLLEHGADVNAAAMDHGGVTPLIVCMTNGRRSPELIDVVKTLLAAGADVNATDDRGVTALDAIRDVRTRARGAKAKVLEDIEKVLLAHGAQPGAGRHGAAKRPGPN